MFLVEALLVKYLCHKAPFAIDALSDFIFYKKRLLFFSYQRGRFWQYSKVKLTANMVYVGSSCLNHNKIKRKCLLTDQPCVGWDLGWVNYFSACT